MYCLRTESRVTTFTPLHSLIYIVSNFLYSVLPLQITNLILNIRPEACFNAKNDCALSLALQIAQSLRTENSY